MMFWIISGLLTAAVVAVLLRPLFLGTPKITNRRADYDLAVYRDQLAELSRDAARGLIDPAAQAMAEAEIGRRMLAAADAVPEIAQPPAARWPRWVLAGLIPLAALALYLPLGSPDLPSQPFNPAAVPPPANPTPPPKVAAALAHLKEHLAGDPKDIGGWQLLGQAQMAMGVPDEAADSFGKAHALAPDDVALADAYAQALTKANDDIVPEAARKIFEVALATDPHDAGARYYLAEARAQAGDLPGAIDRLRSLIAETPADAENLPVMRQLLGDYARQQGVNLDLVMPQPLPPANPVHGPDTGQMAEATQMDPAARDEMIHGMVEKLAARLHDQPGDADGWLRLAHAYAVLKQPDKEQSALNSAVAAAPQRLDVLTAAAGQMLEGIPEDNTTSLPASAIVTLQRIQTLDGDNAMALWYLGQQAASTGSISEAAQLWSHLRDTLPPDSDDRKAVERRLAELPKSDK